jgi:YfiH family protein
LSANDSSFLIAAFPPKTTFRHIAAASTTRTKRKPDSSENSNAESLPKKACDALGVDAASFTSGVQVHGSSVARVTERERGRGALDYYQGIPKTDALVTDVRGVPVGVFTADCVPVFLYDPAGPAIGIVHAGWRSTVQAITATAVEMMVAEFNSNPSEMHGSIGPSIGQCCYEVGLDVYEAFLEAFDYADLLFRETGQEKWHLDLWTANSRQLIDSGLKEEYITNQKLCSFCNSNRFHSARKHGPRAGRILSLIALL